MTKGTRFRSLLREFGGRLSREVRIALAPVPTPTTWVFVVGCYNSGTTLLAELLGRHPLISALPTEGHFLTDQLLQDYYVGLPRMWVEREDLFRMDESDATPDVVRLKKEWAIRLDTSRPVLLEKSPPNSARTRWLQAHFENAHFIALVRNGYAVAEGIRRKAEPRHQARGRWPIDMAARQWARCNEVLLEDSPFVDHLHWVRYESLVGEVEPTLRAVLQFLGLPWDDAVLPGPSMRIHEHAGPLADLNSESIARLSSTDVQKITAVARPMLEHFEYERLESAPSVEGL